MAASFPQIASLLATHGSEAGRTAFRASAVYEQVHAISPAIGDSLMQQFDRDDAVARASVLERMPASVPVKDLSVVTTPARVLACEQDPVHPFGVAAAVAAALPDAPLYPIPAKATGNDPYLHAVHYALRGLVLDTAD